MEVRVSFQAATKEYGDSPWELEEVELVTPATTVVLKWGPGGITGCTLRSRENLEAVLERFCREWESAYSRWGDASSQLEVLPAARTN